MGTKKPTPFYHRGQQKIVQKAVWNLQYIMQAKIQYLWKCCIGRNTWCQWCWTRYTIHTIKKNVYRKNTWDQKPGEIYNSHEPGLYRKGMHYEEISVVTLQSPVARMQPEIPNWHSDFGGQGAEREWTQKLKWARPGLEEKLPWQHTICAVEMAHSHMRVQGICKHRQKQKARYKHPYTYLRRQCGDSLLQEWESLYVSSACSCKKVE
jgi:hypothetical protein